MNLRYAVAIPLLAALMGCTDGGKRPRIVDCNDGGDQCHVAATITAGHACSGTAFGELHSCLILEDPINGGAPIDAGLGFFDCLAADPCDLPASTTYCIADDPSLLSFSTPVSVEVDMDDLRTPTEICSEAFAQQAASVTVGAADGGDDRTLAALSAAYAIPCEFGERFRIDEEVHCGTHGTFIAPNPLPTFVDAFVSLEGADVLRSSQYLESTGADLLLEIDGASSSISVVGSGQVVGIEGVIAANTQTRALVGGEVVSGAVTIGGTTYSQIWAGFGEDIPITRSAGQWVMNLDESRLIVGTTDPLTGQDLSFGVSPNQPAVGRIDLATQTWSVVYTVTTPQGVDLRVVLDGEMVRP